MVRKNSHAVASEHRPTSNGSSHKTRSWCSWLCQITDVRNSMWLPAGSQALPDSGANGAYQPDTIRKKEMPWGDLYPDIYSSIVRRCLAIMPKVIGLCWLVDAFGHTEGPPSCGRYFEQSMVDRPWRVTLVVGLDIALVANELKGMYDTFIRQA